MRRKRGAAYECRVMDTPFCALGKVQQANLGCVSILSASHRELVPETVRLLREQGVDAPVVVGGIIPAVDAKALREAGVARVYTPKDFDLNRIMGEIADLLAERAATAASATSAA